MNSSNLTYIEPKSSFPLPLIPSYLHFASFPTINHYPFPFLLTYSFIHTQTFTSSSLVHLFTRSIHPSIPLLYFFISIIQIKVRSVFFFLFFFLSFLLAFFFLSFFLSRFFLSFFVSFILRWRVLGWDTYVKFKLAFF